MLKTKSLVLSYYQGVGMALKFVVAHGAPLITAPGGSDGGIGTKREV